MVRMTGAAKSLKWEILYCGLEEVGGRRSEAIMLFWMVAGS